MHDSRSGVERAFDALIGHEIRRLNNHLPKQRRLLRGLLAQDNDPTVETVDGTSLLLRRVEIQELAKIVPEEYHTRLRIPFIILRRMEMGRSTYTVVGDQIESFTVQRILGGKTTHITRCISTESGRFSTDLRLRNSLENSTVSS